MLQGCDVIADELLRPETKAAAANAARLTEVQQRERERFDAFANVLIDAIARAADLTESQRRETSQSLQDSIKSTLAKRSEPGAAQRSNGIMWPDLAPVYFTGLGGPARDLQAASLRIANADGLLSEDQRRSLDGFLEDRIQYRQRAALEYVLNLLDNELFLTGGQKPKLARVIQATVHPVATGFIPKSGFDTQLSLADVVPPAAVCTFLTDLQQQRLSDVAEEAAGRARRGGFGAGPSTRPGFVRLQAIDSRKQWSVQLRSTFDGQKERLLRIMELQTVYCQTEGQLKKTDADHLRVAAKGVIEEVLPAWESRLLERMQGFQEVAGGRNEVYWLREMSSHDPEKNELWKQTLSSLVPFDSVLVQSRRNARHNAISGYATAMLDRELWLDPQQREQMQLSIHKALAASDDDYLTREQFSELGILCVPLFRLTESDLAVLNKAQQAALKANKASLTVEGSSVRPKPDVVAMVSLRIP